LHKEKKKKKRKRKQEGIAELQRENAGRSRRPETVSPVKPEVGVRVPCPASESAEDGEENKREGGGDAQDGRRDLRRREAGRLNAGNGQRDMLERE
jgi:hypothetical protein